MKKVIDFRIISLQLCLVSMGYVTILYLKVRFRYEVDAHSTWHDSVWTQFQARSGQERSPILELGYEILACVQYLKSTSPILDFA